MTNDLEIIQSFEKEQELLIASNLVTSSDSGSGGEVLEKDLEYKNLETGFQNSLNLDFFVQNNILVTKRLEAKRTSKMLTKRLDPLVEVPYRDKVVIRFSISEQGPYKQLNKWVQLFIF